MLLKAVTAGAITSVVFAALAAWCNTLGDPWGIVVLVYLWPAFVVISARRNPQSVGLLLLVPLLFWAVVGAFGWYVFTTTRSDRRDSSGS